MKAYYDNIPSVFEAVGNGSYLYRWNITEEKVENENESRTSYVCEEVTLWTPITANSVLEAVITESFPSNYEQKLINDYNAIALGVIKDKDGGVKARYKEFLETRAALKERVDSDWHDFGDVISR